MATSAILLTVIRILCWDPADEGVEPVVSVTAQLGRIGSSGHGASIASGVRGSDSDELLPVELCLRSEEG